MGVLSKITSEYFGEAVRESEGIIVNFWGKEYVMRFDRFPIATRLEKFDNGELFMEKKFDFFNDSVYICRLIENGRFDTTYKYYYLAKEDLEVSSGNILDECFLNLLCSASQDMLENDFLPLNILNKAIGELGEPVIVFDEGFFFVNLKNTKSLNGWDVSNRLEYYIFEDRESAIIEAQDIHYRDLEDNYGEEMDSASAGEYVKAFGTGWIDMDELESSLVNRMIDRYNDMEYEYGEHGNALNDMLIEKGMIEPTKEYFELDLENPKFDPNEYRETLIETMMEYDEITHEEAEEKVDGYKDFEYMDTLISFKIVSEDEDNFPLNYDSPVGNKVSDAVTKLVGKEISESENHVKLYLKKFDLPYDLYDLDELASLSLDKNNLAGYLGDYDAEEHKCVIDGKEYFVYIKA